MDGHSRKVYHGHFEATAISNLIQAKGKAFERAIQSLPFLMRKLLKSFTALYCGELVIVTPHGSFHYIGKEPGPKADLIIRDYKLAWRLLSEGELGFAEAYMNGECDCSDLNAFFELFQLNVRAISNREGLRRMLSWAIRLAHWRRQNTKTQAKKNIHAHYDLGNDFFSAWLDETMTYSSAIYATQQEKLAEAQKNKYERLAQQVDANENSRLLEIGCGWGGFIEHVVKTRGCRVKALTISAAQLDFARKRLFEQGLGEKVDICLQDYRDETGEFDGIVSIEMFEAVGEKYWPHYFNKLRQCLKSGSRSAVQVITIDEFFYENYRKNPDFIQTYIFPGGMLPTKSILRNLGEQSGLKLLDQLDFRLDYAKTLSIWRDRFKQAWPKIKGNKFDNRFARLWEYYLSYCEIGFRLGNIDVGQFTFARD